MYQIMVHGLNSECAGIFLLTNSHLAFNNCTLVILKSVLKHQISLEIANL